MSDRKKRGAVGFKRSKKSREPAKKLAEQLNELYDLRDSLRREQERAECIYHVLQTAPDLLARAEEIAEREPTFPSFQEQIEELDEQIKVVTNKARKISRLFTRAVNIDGWVFHSHSGGKNRTVDLEKLRESGWGSLEIGGTPLIQTKEEVNWKVWDEAVKQGLIDEEKAKRNKLLSVTNKTRRTCFGRADDE